jgi:hypothetical protein
MSKRVAQLGYSEDHHQIELTVPHGTKVAELPLIIEQLNRGGFFGGLGRGCLACHSGDHWYIREALANVVEVDLDKG